MTLPSRSPDNRGGELRAVAKPIVVLAAGGIYTELYRDSTMRIAPVDLDAAREMIAEVKATKTLAGYRGKPAGDLDALAEAVVAVSRLALSAAPYVEEAEVNPLVVMPEGQGVVAIDGLVRIVA